MSQLPDESGTDGADEAETRRIRHVYAARDRRPGRAVAIQRAYALLNAERRQATVRLIERLSSEARRARPTILDVGCGSGLDLADFLDRGWPAERLTGVDLVAERLSAARERCPGVTLRQVDGARLPFADGSFDVATAVTVFSSIMQADRRRALFAEMLRVVAPGGHVIVYDFVVRNPRNRDVTAMPMSRLADMAGRHPDLSIRLSPFLYLVGVASVLGPRAARTAMRVAPPTHRLSAWRRADQPERATSSR